MFSVDVYKEPGQHELMVPSSVSTHGAGRKLASPATCLDSLKHRQECLLWT